MSESKEQIGLEHSENEEIDLGPLFNWVKKIMIGIGELIAAWLKKVVQKWKFVFLTSFITAVLGVLFTFAINSYYESELTVRSGGVDSKLYFDRITTIDQLIEEENYSEIASLLKISEVDAEKIHSIEYERLMFNKSDTSNSKPYFSKVIIAVYDNAILDTLQGAIINYLGDINYIQRNKALEEMRIAKMIKRLKGEIDKLDSLKEIIATSIVQGKEKEGLVYGEPMDPVAVYQESIDLYERKLKLEIIAETLEPIEIVTGFNKFNKPAFPKKKDFAIIGAIVGLLFSLIRISLTKPKS